LITHAMGETVVPEQPQRVVVLGTVPDVLALGIKPVGASTLGIAQRDDAGELPSFLGNQADDIPLVGHTTQPNLESITQLEPDLILGAKGVHDGIYQQLSQIAPTVVIDISQGADAWKQYVRAAANALGKADVADTLLDEYEQRIATFQAEMGVDSPQENRLKNTEVSVVRFRPNVFRPYMRGSFSGAVLAEAGLTRSDYQAQDKSFENLSIEQIGRIDGDVLFLMQDSAENSTLNQVKESPLWSQLNAVQQGQVYEVSLESWFLNPGIVGANLILNDLFRYLVPENDVPEGDRHVVEQVGELTIQ
ncbi:MAG TPA: ABC transporter substrate-binding protein, partial [Elainellaceae cyanobacterium]